MVNSITKYCRQAGWSPQDLVNKLHIPAPVVDQWEKGELTPPAWVEQRVYTLVQEERQLAMRRRPHVALESDPKRRWKP